ncbi:NAD(P)-dependent alcohol dehydrogenase [Rhodococcus erythropolis]|nr:NAD(P)-dependent alcohol dehydrogenase [Rhodococcus sp. (in: high G+C Gram-positive bacteria)]
MRAAILRKHDAQFTIEDVKLGELRQNEVLVEIVGVGICHTDLLLRDPRQAEAIGPAILGHEGSGIVKEVGASVTQVEPGDHVLLSFDSCGTCKNCQSGSPAYCDEFERRNLTGYRADGTTAALDADGKPLANRWFGQSSFGEFAIATERNLVVIDPDLPLGLLGPLGCGLQTGAGAVLNEMKIAPGQSIAVFGAGAVGLAAVMAAKIAGATDIVVVDLHQSRLDIALQVGATRVVRGDADDVADQVRNGTPGMDFTFDTTAVGAVISTAVDVLARPGKAVLVGAGTDEVRVSPIALAGRSITFVLEGNAVPQIFIPQLIEYWRDGRFPFDQFVNVYPFEEINRAELDSLSGHTIKPVLTFGSERS